MIACGRHLSLPSPDPLMCICLMAYYSVDEDNVSRLCLIDSIKHFVLNTIVTAADAVSFWNRPV